MTAHDQMRAMLDQLMGTARNGAEEKLSIKFDDDRVCRSFLLSCCPHEVLASTTPGVERVGPHARRGRMDMGECSKIHNVALRADYEAAALKKDYFFDLEALDQLNQFIGDADRKTEQAKKRLAETQSEVNSDVGAKAEKVHELAEKIGEKLAAAERLGEEGNVDASMKLMEEIEGLKKLKSEAESEYRSSIPAAAYQQQKLRVCEVCCAYLGIHDNDRRLADHFGGKLHLGFIKIREMAKTFQANAEERRRARRESLRHNSSARRRSSDDSSHRRSSHRRSRSRSPRDRVARSPRSRSPRSRSPNSRSSHSNHHRSSRKVR